MVYRAYHSVNLYGRASQPYSLQDNSVPHVPIKASYENAVPRGHVDVTLCRRVIGYTPPPCVRFSRVDVIWSDTTVLLPLAMCILGSLVTQGLDLSLEQRGSAKLYVRIAVLVLRTYALWMKNRRILISLGIFYCVCTSMNSYLVLNSNNLPKRVQVTNITGMIIIISSENALRCKCVKSLRFCHS